MRSWELINVLVIHPYLQWYRLSQKQAVINWTHDYEMIGTLN